MGETAIICAAVVACVALPVAAGLDAWRRWLAHAAAVATSRAETQRADLDGLPVRLKALEERLRDVEFRAGAKR